MVRPEKLQALKDRMAELGIKESDLEEKFIKGSGKGGQKVNKTNNCVYLKHKPTGIAVKCHMDRSRELNRFLARRELCEEYVRVIHQGKPLRKHAIQMMHRPRNK